MKARVAGVVLVGLTAALSLSACAGSPDNPDVPSAPAHNTDPRAGWVQVTSGVPGWRDDYSEMWKTCDGSNLIYVRGDTRAAPFVLPDNAECK